jgi:hypothetical protein
MMPIVQLADLGLKPVVWLERMNVWCDARGI